MRLRFILPFASVSLGVFLFYLGDLQAERMLHMPHGEEGLVDAAAKARYVHYAINAPAWALVGNTRSHLWSRSTYWTGDDLNYFLAVIILWFCAGFALDRRFLSKNTAASTGASAWWIRLAGLTAILLGTYTGCSVPPPKPYFMTWANYVAMLTNNLGGDALWWYPLGFGWSLVLVATGSYCLIRSVKSASSIRQQ